MDFCIPYEYGNKRCSDCNSSWFCGTGNYDFRICTYKKTTLKLARPHHWFKGFKKIIVTGFSSGVSALAVIAVSFIANNQIMNYFGGVALAVYGVLGTVSSLFTSIFSGIG